MFSKKVVREAGVEPTTYGSGGRHSIQLSYSRNRFTEQTFTPNSGSQARKNQIKLPLKSFPAPLVHPVISCLFSNDAGSAS